MPAFPLIEANLLTAFGLLLLLGVVGGHAVASWLKLPRISGYIIVGLLLGEFFGSTFFARTTPFIQLGLALALFEVARRVDLHWLKRERALASVALLCALAAGAVLFVFLSGTGFAAPEALLLASLGLGSAPAIILSVTRESRAEGMVTDRLLVLTASGNLLGFACFSLALAWLLQTQRMGVETWLLRPGLSLLLGTAAGIGTGYLAVWLARWMGPQHKMTRQTMLFALVAVLTGLAELFSVTPALPAAVFGLAIRNIRQGYAIVEPQPLTWTPILLLGLFVATGMQIDLRLLLNYGLFAAGYLLLRLAAFALVLLPTSRSSALGWQRASWLALGLTPVSSGAFILYVSIPTSLASPALHGTLLSLLALSGLLGPLLTRLALEKSGETGREMH